MKYNIYLLSFNNYNNRQVKGKSFTTIAQFISAGYQVGQTVTNVNFEFKDGIMSQLLINQAFVDTQPDYVLIAERGSDGLETGYFSRWFILDSDLIRGNQYKFTVKRDICIDYNDLLLNSQYFIERGYVNSSSDLIFNDEGQQYSQIKKSQTPLYDETGVPWIVGYMPKKLEISSDVTVKSYVRPESADIVVSSLASWDYYDYVSSSPNFHPAMGDSAITDPYRFIVVLPVHEVTTGGNTYHTLYMNISASNKSIESDDLAYYMTVYPSTFTIQEPGIGYFTRNQTQFNSDTSTYGWYDTYYTGQQLYIPILNRMLLNQNVTALNNLSSQAYSNLIQSFRGIHNVNNNVVSYIENNLNGKVIKDNTTGKLYNITLNITGYGYDEGGGNATSIASVKSQIRSFLNLSIGNQYAQTDYGYVTHSTSSEQDAAIKLRMTLRAVSIVLTEVASTRTYVPKDDDESGTSPVVYRNHCVNQMYDIFAIPYGALNIKNGANTITTNKDVGLSIAQQIATAFQTFVYDLQLLPYCPCREYIQNDGTFDITGVDSTKVRPIYYGDSSLNPLNYVFYCSSSKIDDINLLHKVDNQWVPYSIEVTNVKKQYNTEMYRLSSPNFASSFEFNAAQNGGVNSFIVSATYKPYNPYIRIRPQFGRMYGQDFKDGRGLILQGDFSLATMNDAWIQYELQNKNYLNSFNREIQSMNLQNKIASTQDIVQAITGSVQGTVSGAIAGGMMGGAYGAVAGAVVGGVSSTVGGVIDVQNNKKLRNDAIDKAKTLFNYQLDNIKALPNTIRNVGALTVDNVLVPVLEFYQASDDELDTFDKKIRYYGMSVMKVGQIIEYINPNEETFVQGYLLRLLPPDGVIEEADNHLAEELSNEVQKGLYIGG